MPLLDASLLECLILDGVPGCPKEKTAVALTLAVNASELGSLETYYGSTSAPAFRLCFGPDSQAMEIERLRADLNKAAAELQRYRDAYDKNPPEGASRMALVEVE